jgi:hypothetical protein
VRDARSGDVGPDAGEVAAVSGGVWNTIVLPKARRGCREGDRACHSCRQAAATEERAPPVHQRSALARLNIEHRHPPVQIRCAPRAASCCFRTYCKAAQNCKRVRERQRLAETHQRQSQRGRSRRCCTESPRAPDLDRAARTRAHTRRRNPSSVHSKLRHWAGQCRIVRHPGNVQALHRAVASGPRPSSRGWALPRLPEASSWRSSCSIHSR